MPDVCSVVRQALSWAAWSFLPSAWHQRHAVLHKATNFSLEYVHLLRLTVTATATVRILVPMCVHGEGFHDMSEADSTQQGKFQG